MTGEFTGLSCCILILGKGSKQDGGGGGGGVTSPISRIFSVDVKHHVYLVTYKNRVLSYFNVLNCCFVDLFECTCYLESRSRLVKQCLFCFDFLVILWLD